MAEIHCNFFSYCLGYPVDLTLLLPSMSACDMDDPKTMTHRVAAKYPILCLLHGHGNDYLSWNRYTGIQRYAEERRIAVATVSVGNKGYMNAEYGEKYYDFIRDELPEFLTANFPISSRREDTYIAGNSMGGYGALAHALGHPESYRAVGAFSPATDWGEGIADRLGHSMPPMMSLFELLEKDLNGRKELPEMYFCIGSRDFLIESADRFHQHLDSLSIKHQYHRIDGYEHEWGFWDLELPRFLDWLPRTDIYADMDPRKV